MVSGHGPYLTDADGLEYVDCVGSWGPMILGHAHPAVVEAVRAAAGRGLSFGTPTQGEVELAVELINRVSPVEQVRLVNSTASSTFGRVPNDSPHQAAARTASTTRRMRVPIMGPHDPMQSTYSSRSACIRDRTVPYPRCAPTARNARTGEFTPPEPLTQSTTPRCRCLRHPSVFQPPVMLSVQPSSCYRRFPS